MSSAASRALGALGARSTAGSTAVMPQNDVGARASSASCTVSRTVSSGNSVAAWNVRPSPARARRCAGSAADVAPEQLDRARRLGT